MIKNQKLGVLFTVTAVVFFIFFLGSYFARKSRRPAPIGPFVSTDTVRPILKVQVAGLVKNPGVYDLPGGSRVQDAINAAGGPLAGANVNALNLADWVTDGSKIEVSSGPKIEAPPILAPSPPVSMVPAAPLVVPTIAPTPATAVTGKQSDVYLEHLRNNPVNINTADATQIQALPDIGPKMAERIVEFRNANGPFKTVEDLDKVKGIGEKRIEALRGLVIVQ